MVPWLAGGEPGLPIPPISAYVVEAEQATRATLWVHGRDVYQPLWLFSLYLGINHRFALGLTDCFQVPRISATNQALYTPGDEQAGLARPGESVAFSLWTNNSGNIDLHHVHLLPKAGEHELAVCCLRMSRRIALVLRECGRYACSECSQPSKPIVCMQACHVVLPGWHEPAHHGSPSALLDG